MILEKVSSYQQYCAADNTNTPQDVTDDDVAGKKYRELLNVYFVSIFTPINIQYLIYNLYQLFQSGWWMVILG